MDRRTLVVVLSLLLALAVCPYFVDLDGSSIWDANEAFYVETPREMRESGDYVSPTFNYEPRLNKPVLSYWIVAGFYHLFGVSVGVQRVAIALGAMAMIATAFFLALAASSAHGRPVADSQGRTHDSRRSGVNADTTPDSQLAAPEACGIEAGLWAALGLAITPRLLMFARRIFIDVYTSMFLGLTLLFFALAERYAERRRLFLLLMYLAAALGVLTKGPIAIVLPGLVFGLYLLAHRELGRIRAMMLPSGMMIIAALVVPYYAALYVRHGSLPITAFILGENVARYTNGVGVDADRPGWFYLPVIFSDSFPWSAFLFVAAASWLRERGATGPHADPPGRVRTLMWLWIAAIVLFFTASAAKQDLYIFPIVPAVAALAGVVIARGWTPGIRRTAMVIGVVAAVAGAGMWYLGGSDRGTYVIQGARTMGAVGLAGGLVVLAASLARRTRAAVLAIVLTFIVLDWIFVLRVLPRFERYKPVPGFAQTLASRLRPDDLVATYDEALPSLVYYLRRRVDPFFNADELIARFKSGRTVYAVLSADNYRELSDQLGSPTCVIDRRPTFDVKLKNMLSRDALPELLLITNRCHAQ